ncbi:MAG: hypothetical protein H6841_06350 [Planctomycetes bacterium]|nr:hypothetical protein [Planctomycetota bacterium]MCB9936056.1 hypothetical protein [Planctomycetota bacterium]
MAPENEKPDDEERTITEVGRELLKYLHRRMEELGTNQASYRQARMELLKHLEENRPRKRFNWGFEAVFTQEIHTLEELGLVSVKYGSGAIMAGRTSPNQIYNVSLTEDGKDTARVILEREYQHRKDTARLEESQAEELADDEDEDDLDDTDQAPEESTKINKPQGLPGDAAAHDAPEDE